MRSSLLLLLAAVLGLAGCKAAGGEAATGAAQAANEAPARHRESGLALQDLVVTSGQREHRFRVEMAMSEEEQARGLMFRTALGADEGMLFPMNPPREASFWMKNTVIPLDIIYIAPNGTIGRIAANTTPYSLDPIPSMAPVSAVLELRGGRAAELGITSGDRVRW